MKFILLVIFPVFVLYSCATHTGTISASFPATRVVYEDVAIGVVSTSNFLGIGGTNKDGLIYEAKKNLINNRPLNTNEEYLNFTIDFKRTNYLIINKIQATVTCDVVTRSNDISRPIYSNIYKAKVFNPIPNSLFQVGDSIFTSDDKKGIIISIKNNRKVFFVSKISDDSEKMKMCLIENVYAINKSYNSIKTGETYNTKVTLSSGFEEELKNAKIIGVGINEFVVTNDKGQYFYLKYPKNK